MPTHVPSCAFVASGASAIAFNFPSLGLRTSIGSNVLRAGNNSLPQQGYRIEPQYERAPNTAHSFFARYGTTGARYEQYWIFDRTLNAAGLRWRGLIAFPPFCMAHSLGGWR